MAFILLVFAVGVLNIGLGFALAMFLPFRLPGLGRVWRLLGSRRRTRRMRAEAPRGALQELSQPATPRGAPLPAAVEEAFAPVREPGASDVETFGQFVATSVSSLTDFAARLKRSNRDNHQRTAWDFVAELQGICQAHLEKLTLAMERLSDDLGDEVQAVVLEQASQLETTLSNLHYMSFDSDLSSAMGRLSEDVGNTLSTARRLQEALEVSRGSIDQRAPIVAMDRASAVVESS